MPRDHDDPLHAVAACLDAVAGAVLDEGRVLEDEMERCAWGCVINVRHDHPEDAKRCAEWAYELHWLKLRLLDAYCKLAAVARDARREREATT